MACGNDDDVEQDKIYTGKLVIQGVCMHYVIQVNDTDFPQELIEKNWTDEVQGLNMKMFLLYEEMGIRQKVYVISPKILKKEILFNL